MELLHQRLGPHAMVDDLAELGADDTLQYDLHEDKSQNAETFLTVEEEPEVTPEWETAPKRGQNVQRLSDTL